MLRYDRNIGFVATSDQRDQLEMIAQWHEWSMSRTLRHLIEREAAHYSKDGEIRSNVDVYVGGELLFDNSLLLLGRVLGFDEQDPRWTLNAPPGDIVDAVKLAVERLRGVYSLGAEILVARYGLDLSRQRRTHDQVIWMFGGITAREQVRQIEAKALRYLRNPERVAPLRALVDRGR
jgi:hypothetical protein